MVKRHERIRGTAVGIHGNIATLTEARDSNPSGARERNRVSRIFNGSLRGILSALMLTAFFCAYSNPVEFKQCVPASGSTISSFNFELEFDIEKALEAAAKDAPGVNVGIGYTGGADGSSSAGNATLYKGDEISGEIIGTSLNANFTGKSAGFTVNGNKVKMIFDDAIPLLANQEYTIKITNNFYLYKENAATRVTSTRHDFHDNPIILKFIGAGVGDSKIFVEGSNIENGSSFEKIENLEFNLTAPFTINPGAEVLIKEGDNVIARTSELRASSADDKILVADFGNNAVLYLGHNYTVVLPAGAVSISSNSNASNLEYSVDVKGLSNFVIKLASSNVEKDDKGIPVSITFIYDMPEGTVLSDQTGISEAAIGYSRATNSDNVGRRRGDIVENGKGFKWSFSKDYWLPDTEYTFRKEATSIYVCDASGNYLPEYVNEVNEISFTTPSVDVWNYPPMEFATPIVEKTEIEDAADYEEGMKRQYIGAINFWLKDETYTLDGNRYDLALHPDLNEVDKNIVNVYEITPTGDKKISTAKIGIKYNMQDAYSIGYARLNAYFYEGKKYKLVIPEGSYYVRLYNDITDKSKLNTIRNKEMVFTFEGTSPNKVILESCNIPDNSVISNLYTINWLFKGNYRLSYEITSVPYKVTLTNPTQGTITSNRTIPANVSYADAIGKTYLYLDFMSKASGNPTNVSSKESYVVTIPKGMLINVMNDEIVNEEIVLTFKGGEEKSLEPETVAVNLTVNGMHTSTHPAIKGKEYSFNFSPAENWEVESVKHGDKTLDVDNAGMYVTEPLNADAEIKANLRYAGSWATDITTDVWQIESKKISIRRENDMIVVDGVTPDNTICVYNVAGLLINSTRTTDGNDRVRISVPLGQVYIVTVDGFAARIMMTERQ